MTTIHDTDESIMRLQRFLARCGVASRRASEKLISSGRIEVNGKVITELGTKIDSAKDVVCFDGHVLSLPKQEILIALNKPVGYVTTMSDPQGRKTVAELIPTDLFPSLFPLGRLDVDTSGLLLFSTDGKLGNLLLHPSHHVDKCYRANVKGKLTESDALKLEEGVLLADGMTAPAKCDLIKCTDDQSVAELTIHEGRNRQVRRMFDAIGHPVEKLTRISFGPITLDKLKSGEWRELTEYECDRLRTSITPK